MRGLFSRLPMTMRTTLFSAAFAAVVIAGASVYLLRSLIPGTANLDAVREIVVPELESRLAEQGLHFGAPIFIRIFKASSELELWVQDGAQYSLFKTYPICSYSGGLGPKLMEGDRQSPEGFYSVSARQLNPNSSYHLSFNLGFPNRYDRAHGRTGSFLMVHGKCVSIGCYAMTDGGIEEIYLIAEAALSGGQSAFDVHVFPFRMTEEALTDYAGSQWISFWQNLKEGHDLFEATRVPPTTGVVDGRYAFNGG
ncbi:L,D-transpeptidase family protein [Hoeflea poritis]|uniref:Murein L,D-transpeptidase n=1 Tax=Hoeflea poritis TaxID=2993659 RepID=A0ABT4VMW6_9HYPH|nr:murein L,D-transpeptidase family protein [Hoeflea poritis]MDA4846010.1 murein L,D-transpeptidase [Hoeflea poritis]